MAGRRPGGRPTTTRERRVGSIRARGRARVATVAIVQKTVTFWQTRFTGAVIAEALRAMDDAHREVVTRLFPEADRADPGARAQVSAMSVSADFTEWTYDSLDEFVAALREPYDTATITLTGYGPRVVVTLHSTYATVSATHDTRGKVERLLSPFEDAREACALPAALSVDPTPKVFIGHGRSRDWRDLKDHLQEHHGYEVVAYETGARGGLTIQQVLADMLDDSTFAVLVMTAEDEQSDGEIRPRQNVVHEAGLFQGRLGFPRTLILSESGVQLFSNLDGIQYVPFGRHNIRATFGDVLATLRREFPGRY